MPLSPFSTVGAASPAAPYVRSIVKAMKLPMTDIRNMDVVAEARHCLFSDADGDCFQAELGDATVAARNIMQGALDESRTPDQKLLRAVSWLTPGSGEYPGNRVLRPVAMLGVLHTSVNALLQASPGDKMLEKQEEKIRSQIILLGRAIGACKHAPSGGYDIDDDAATKALSRKHLKAAHTTVVECIQMIGSERVFNTIAREFVAPAMLVALERENKAAHALAIEGKLDGDGVMNLLEPELVNFTNKQVQRELFKGNFNGYMEAMSELMKLPHYVMKGQSAKSGPAEDARKPQDNGFPQNLLDHSRGTGAPIAYNHNSIDLKGLGAEIRETGVASAKNYQDQVEWIVNKLMEAYESGFARGKEVGVLGQQLESIRNERDGLRAENERMSEQLNSRNAVVADQQIKIAQPAEPSIEVHEVDQRLDVPLNEPMVMAAVTIHESGIEPMQFQGQGDVEVVDPPQVLDPQSVHNPQDTVVPGVPRDAVSDRDTQGRRDSTVIPFRGTQISDLSVKVLESAGDLDEVPPFTFRSETIGRVSNPDQLSRDVDHDDGAVPRQDIFHVSGDVHHVKPEYRAERTVSELVKMFSAPPPAGNRGAAEVSLLRTSSRESRSGDTTRSPSLPANSTGLQGALQDEYQGYLKALKEQPLEHEMLDAGEDHFVKPFAEWTGQPVDETKHQNIRVDDLRKYLSQQRLVNGNVPVARPLSHPLQGGKAIEAKSDLQKFFSARTEKLSVADALKKSGAGKPTGGMAHAMRQRERIEDQIVRISRAPGFFTEVSQQGLDRTLTQIPDLNAPFSRVLVDTGEDLQARLDRLRNSLDTLAQEGWGDDGSAAADEAAHGATRVSVSSPVSHSAPRSPSTTPSVSVVGSVGPSPLITRAEPADKKERRQAMTEDLMNSLKNPKLRKTSPLWANMVEGERPFSAREARA